MSLLKRYIDDLKHSTLFSKKDKLLVAVSGGVDSIVLCELCKQAALDFSMAHCNFQLRGEESDRDEEFVKNIGEKYGVKVFIKKFETEKYALETKCSIQEAARELRYSWFDELVNPTTNKTYDHLLTAHHLDDNIETIAMHFFRGTGLHGLTGIPMANKYIKRPLLNYSKEELMTFAEENNLAFVEDSSNKSLKYTRNYFRNELIPAISKIYPKVKENLQNNIARFKEIEMLYKLSVGELKKKICKHKGNEIHIPVKKLMQYNNRALIFEIIADYHFQEKQIDEIIKLADSPSGKFISSPDKQYRIIKHRHWFIITPIGTDYSENIVIEENDKLVLFPNGHLNIESISKSNPSGSDAIATLDSKEIRYPLLLRRWKTGDYFYPLGMNKKKKLSRFFIDQKLSKTEKENTWVIESQQRIIWVIGHRIDNRFRITEKTQSVLKISLQLK